MDPSTVKERGLQNDEYRSSRFLKLLALALVGLMALGAFVLGYLGGRGVWAIPGSISSSLPSAIAQRLPASLKPLPPPSAGSLPDYEFQLVRQEFQQANGVPIDIRLVHKPSGKPVRDAVIFAYRIDMAPDGMPTMTSKLEPQPSPEPAVYRFTAALTMEGGWQLSLAAKVQGETGTVQNKLVLKAVP